MFGGKPYTRKTFRRTYKKKGKSNYRKYGGRYKKAYKGPKRYVFWRGMLDRPVYSGGAVNQYGGDTHLNGIQQLIAHGDFENMFDDYRIEQVEIKFWLYCDPGGVNTLTQSTLPRLHWYRDYDSLGSPLSVADIMERQNAKSAMISPYRPLVIRYKPNTISQSTNALGIPFTTSVDWDKFFDLNYNDQHVWYGIRFFLENLGPAATVRVVSEGRVKLSCRMVR